MGADYKLFSELKLRMLRGKQFSFKDSQKRQPQITIPTTCLIFFNGKTILGKDQEGQN